MSEKSQREQFEEFLVRYTGRDMNYHKRYETLNIGPDSFAFACWKEAQKVQLENIANLHETNSCARSSKPKRGIN